MRVGQLRPWDVHDRLRIPVEADVAHVAGNADDLARRFLEHRPQALADGDACAQRIAVGPVSLCHGLVDDDDAGRAAAVLVGETAAAQNGNLEHGEVGRRDRREPAAAMKRTGGERAPLDDERQAEAAFERYAARRARHFDARNRPQPLAAVTSQLTDRGGLRKPRAGQRHPHRQYVVRVEARVHRAQREEGSDEECGADEEHERQSHLGDHQECPRPVLPEPGTRSPAAFLDRAAQIGA